MTKDDIVDAVCEVMDISRAAMFSPGRRQRDARGRQLAMYLIQDLLSVSTTFQGLYFSRDHSTISHAVRRISGHLETSDVIRDYHRRSLMLLAERSRGRTA